METHSTPNLRRLKSELNQEYINIQLQEEILWKQRATCNWNINGDWNTTFFHAYVKKRDKNKRIEMLKLRSGEWWSDVNVLKAEVVKYFSKLYAHDGESYKSWNLKGKFSQISLDEYSALAREVSNEEIKTALFQMGHLKAPGVDGVQAFFFQKKLEYHWGFYLPNYSKHF